MGMTIRVFVQGRVQGVGFRAHVQRSACALGLKGEVWNRADGQVEAIVAGPGERLAALKNLLEQGPGRVDAVHFEPAAEFEGEGFKIGASRP